MLGAYIVENAKIRYGYDLDKVLYCSKSKKGAALVFFQ